MYRVLEDGCEPNHGWYLKKPNKYSSNKNNNNSLLYYTCTLLTLSGLLRSGPKGIHQPGRDLTGY